MKGLSTAEKIPAGQLPAEKNRHSTSSSVGVISKVLRILEVLQTSSVGLGLKAICDETGINKNTAHRFLRHLERESYLLRTEAGSYLIGPRLGSLRQSECHASGGRAPDPVRFVAVYSGNSESGCARPGNRPLCRCHGKPA
jgi:hypothetical protein